MKQLVGVWMVLVAFLLGSCNSDNVMDAYSERGADSDKDILLASSDGLYSEIEQLGKTDFALLSHAMFNRINGVELEGNGRFVEALIGLGQLMYEGQSTDCYYDELMKLTFDKEYYCNVLYSQGFGVWAWDAASNGFVKTSTHESDVVFTFPASASDNENAAVLTISELSIYEGVFPGKGEVLENGTVMSNALEALKFNIKVNDQLVLTSNVLSSFNTQGFYNDVAMTFNPKPYNLSGDLARVDEYGFWMFSFWNDDQVILNHNLSLSIDADNVQMPISHIDDALLIKDVVLETRARTGELYNKLLDVYQLQENSKERAVMLASVLNNYASMDVRYVSDNTIIAQIQAVAKPSVDDDAIWWVDLEFEFSDGSRMSGELYFEDYLANFKTELEQIVGEFELKFGI